MKTTISLKVAIILLAATALSFAYDLEYKKVENGKISVLVPKGFVYQNKITFKPKPGSSVPDDYFFNKDTSEEVEFIKYPLYMPNLITFKPLMDRAMKTEAKATYYNDTATINGTKMYVMEYEATDEGKMKYVKVYLFNIKDTTYMAGTGCHIGLKNEWKPTSDKILNSLRLN
jgi:hypothetical protein